MVLRKSFINPFTAKCGQKQNSTKISEFHWVKSLKTNSILRKYRQRRTLGFCSHSTLKEELPYITPLFTLAVKGLTILNLQNVSPKTFLEFWPSINNFFFLREISQKLGTNKGSKRGWWRHVTSVARFARSSVLMENSCGIKRCIWL